MLWMAMPPTAFLSLATLLTYLLFRLIYLATAPKAIRNHPHEGGTIDPLRTFVLPWLFFGLELLVLRMRPLSQRTSCVSYMAVDIFST